MSARSTVLVLSRHRAGDSDLIARIYSRWGVGTLLVRDGLLPENRFHGIFEPFNLMVLDFHQRGEVLIPEDFRDLIRYSLLSSDYVRFLWMNHVCDFIIRKVRFYDERLFTRLIELLLTEPGESAGILKVLLRLDFVKFSGITPRFLEQKVPRGKARVRLSDGSINSKGEAEVSPGALRLLQKLSEARNIKRISAPDKICDEAVRLLDSLIDYHTR